MKWFKDLGISWKLTLAFSLTTLMTLGLGVLALDRLSRINAELEEIGDTWVPSVQELGEMRSMLGEYRIFELTRLGLAGDMAAADALVPQLEQARKAIADAENRYSNLPGEMSDQQKALYARVSEGYRTYFDAHDRIEAALSRGDLTTATAISDTESREARSELFVSVKDLVDYNVASLTRQVHATSDQYHATVNVIVIVLVALLVLSALLGWLIARSIAMPLRRAAQISDHIAQGQLDNTITVNSRDEAGQLLHAMQRMQRLLQEVTASQKEMAHQHDLGTISHRIDDSRFPGEFGTMARTVNDMVAQHIGVKMRVVEVMQRYARGDLSADMDRLPGEKAVITQAMDDTKASLAAINGEIKRLASAAAAGDFSQRGDANRFEHDFRAMVDGLNQLMSTTEDNLDHLSRMLRAIANGDLTCRMEGQFHGVFARMRDDADVTIDNLTNIVHRIQSASQSIRHAAGEIASGNQDLSRRTEQQAANLEETAASMEELTSTVRQNAEHARQANQLALGAATVATDGGAVIGQVISTMGEIEKASRRIADIISVIDGIAFQTNILALNAAVEAARAGEQGRGFAVVAGEVRTLAQRSAGAAKDIKSLIDESVSRVSDGSALVNRAGTTMQEIVGSVQRVTDIMAEISAASQEQSTGIEQVSQTVMQLDETTQQNAALVEEATAAARAMEEQSQHLVQAVGVFQVAGQASADKVQQRSLPDNVLPMPVPRQRTAPQAPVSPRVPVEHRQQMAAEPEGQWQEF